MVGVYAITVTPGHSFVEDDFAAYVIHAANLVEGRPYTAINYIPNPDALWIGPARGYPPVYPLLLAPVYKLYGFNFRAMKVLTVLCFGGFLAAYVSLLKRRLPSWALLAVVLVVGCNVVFWELRDYVLSELPYLMFSFCALVVARKVYQDLNPRSWRLGDALLLSFLLYAAYGTRTIGAALLPALVLGDLCKFRRPSRFSLVVVGVTASLMAMQNILFVSPRAYLDAVHLSVGSFFQHALFYAKTLTYVWQNGYSKTAQIAFALVFTAFAAIGFARRMWTERSVAEFYLLIYLAILIGWSTEIGRRGLAPVLPLYFAYGFEELVRIFSQLGRAQRAAFATLLFAAISVTYVGAFRQYSRRERVLNVLDQPAQELFSFLRATTQPGEVLVFPKPRTLALFTNRPVATLGPGESPEQSARFLASIHARVLVQTETVAYQVQHLTESKHVSLSPVFRNADFQVFLIDVRP